MTASNNSGRIGRLGLAAVATLALAATVTSSAFLSTPQPRAGGLITADRAAAQPVAAAPAMGAYRRASQSSTATWQVVGAAVLLLASAAVPRRASKTSSTPRCRVVGCQAMSVVAPTPVAPTPLVARVSVPSAPPQLILAEPVLIDLIATEEALPQHVFMTAIPEVPSVVPVVSMQDAVPEAVPEEQGHAAAAPRGSSARFVGGARRSENHYSSAKSSRAARAARRSMGARLQPACVAEPVVCSFDVSKARAPIQHGLKMAVRLHARSGKDIKSPTNNKETCDEGVGISSSYFDNHKYNLL